MALICGLSSVFSWCRCDGSFQIRHEDKSGRVILELGCDMRCFSHMFFEKWCVSMIFMIFMIYESYDSWDEYNINYYLYLYTYTQMWCDAVFCAWPRCRDLGRGFDLAEMLELVRNFRPCRCGSESKRSIDVCHIWSYMCHVYIYIHILWAYMIIYMRSHDVFLLLMRRNSEIPLALNPRNCNFRAWGRAWPRALLSLQRRSFSVEFPVFSLVNQIQGKTYKIERQDISRTHMGNWQCPMLPSCHCSLTSCQSGVSKCLSLTQSCEIFSVSISSSSKKY